MRLGELVRDLPIALDARWRDVEVTGIRHDSRRVAPGDLFVAWDGERSPAAEFVPEAARRGAVAALLATDLSAAVDLPSLRGDDPRRLLGSLAARLYEHPEAALQLIAITGTDGKTTVAALIAAMLEATGRATGLMGTLGHRFREIELESDRTTLEADDFFELLRRMADSGAEAAVLEASSHALAQGRTEPATFDVAVFTNLSRDHLDYHGSMESYFAAKAALFERLRPGGRGVVNADDPFGLRLLRSHPNALSFGARGQVRLLRVEYSTRGTEAAIATPRGTLEIRTALLGAYNAQNVLAAVAAAECLDLPHEACAAALAGLPVVTGRLEPVRRGQEFTVLVDYAHTPAALRAALQSVRELSDAQGRLLVVFGCGGERDTGKRRLMGEVVAELADIAILTSDNPRREDAQQILAQAEDGLRQGRARYEVIADRREAIARAVALAEPGWAVVVAGKGHETHQTIGDLRIPFSDRTEVERALEARLGTTGDS